ncbi:MAG: DNA polymerase III subunit gamma/tau [candidate division Zixibacteria bacterium]|nr:DNA polymerase III subunit gamma/tau [candidate division Zixibacteria bacterium]
MSYLVLARKYRPQRFEDIVAQEHVSRTLQNAVKNDRVGSGYLFCGPRGTGKTTTARVLAKALNCVNGPTPDPCGQCDACKEITAGSSLDVLEIDAASNTGVDDVRTLRENVRYLPAGGKKRIYIIDEVHRLSGAAFDALLKTLEEPPPHVIFMFATTEPTKVPETIMSRTQRFDLKRVSAKALASHLTLIARKEGLEIEEAAISLLARKADGSVRDSLSLLDQLTAFASEKITSETVVSALGLVDRQMLFSFVNAVAARDSKGVLALIRQVIEGGGDISDFTAELLEHLRLLMVLATDEEAGQLLGFSGDELTELSQQAGNFALGDIVRMIKIGMDLNRDLKSKSGLDERLLLDVAAIKMAEMEGTVRFEEILAHLKQGPAPTATGNLFGPDQKKKGEPQASAGLKLVRSEEPPQAPIAEPFKSRAVHLVMMRTGWKSFIGRLKQKNSMLASQLAMAEVRDVKDNRILAVFGRSAGVARQLAEKPANVSLIKAALADQFAANLSITFETDSQKDDEKIDNDKKQSTSVDLKKLVEESPRLQKLMEKVDGEIIGVRNGE